MPSQVFVDESGSSGQGIHMVMAGLIADSESWAEFSNEWRSCLDEHPKIPIFKMSHAANISGYFYNFSIDDRDKKLKKLARIINQYVSCAICSIVDVQEHKKSLGLLPKPHNHPYFHLFNTLLLGSAMELWDDGLREKFEIIFDEHLSTGKKAKKYFPVIREIMRISYPNVFQIIPADIIFRKDDDFMPLQACDLFAWWIRHNYDNQEERAFDWLLDEMKNVKTSDHSCYFDKERIDKLMIATLKIDREDIPDDLIPRPATQSPTIGPAKSYHINWSAAPEGTTHIMVNDIYTIYSDGMPQDYSQWERHVNNECYEYCGENKEWQFFAYADNITAEGKNWRIARPVSDDPVDLPEKNNNQKSAKDFLMAAIGHMQDRASTYDKPNGERSVGKTVAAFNVITGLNLTEEQGWLFMGILKMVRSQQGDFKADNYEDEAAYAGLRGECASRDRQNG